MADPNHHMKLYVGDLAGQLAIAKAQIDALTAEHQRVVGENALLLRQIADLQAHLARTGGAAGPASERPASVRPFPDRPEPGA